MDLFEIVYEKSCTIALKSQTKDECLSELAELVAVDLPAFSGDQILEVFLERESHGSTGFEDGVAIPHARVKGLDRFRVGIAISQKGIDFNSVDRKKCLICCGMRA